MSRLIKVKMELVDATHLYANRYVADGTGQWDRRLKSMSPYRKTASLDRTFEHNTIEIEIDDTDLKLATMFASATNRKIFGKAVTVYVYRQDDATLADTLIMSVRNWWRTESGVMFECAFEASGLLDAIIPGRDLFITETDFPEATPRAIGKPVLFPSGVCAAPGGKLRCWKVVDEDPGVSNRKYLITWSDPDENSRIISIDKVYANGKKINASRYSLSRDEDGWEYCEYNGQLPKIRLNVTASSDTDGSGTSTNPVVALRRILTDAGVTLVDDGSRSASYPLVDFEICCDDWGWEISAAPEYAMTVKEYVETWCASFNCFWYVDSSGQVHIVHFDLTGLSGVSPSTDVVLCDQHFAAFNETSSMNDFANKLRARFNPVNGEWDSEVLYDSLVADYSPATTPIEREEEYAFATIDPAHVDYDKRLRWYDHARQIITGTIPLDTYERIGLGILDAVNVNHRNMIASSSQETYIILGEELDYENEFVVVTMFCTHSKEA